MKAHLPRLIEKPIRHALARGKSILLLGPRQTGKTTLVREQLQPDMSYSFATGSVRQRYEKNPELLEKELIEKIKTHKKKPLIFIDEVQKIPRVMDIAQHLIDDQLAQFILSGSSARKLKTGRELNLLPGRVVAFTMTPLLQDELPKHVSLEDLLLYGSLPGITTELNSDDREADLQSYVTTYLEEEIRAEALVRNVGSFTRFLEVAAGESGKQLNFTKLSQEIGVSDTTIKSYYQILEDCLIASRVDPVIKTQTKRRLIKSPKYLFFDLGVRRACANEGVRLPQHVLGDLFEHYVGNELIHQSELCSRKIKVRYWRDSAGPQVDFVLDVEHEYIPIEVKWSDKPDRSDVKQLEKFMAEYPEAKLAYVICRSPNRYKITEKIMALPWNEIAGLVENLSFHDI
ncbi:MAG: ATP-binding protein [Gammaproteobacteria bacterium]|nr:ATP-binding protein [Gammaproteobacteria bacterium]